MFFLLESSTKRHLLKMAKEIILRWAKTYFRDQDFESLNDSQKEIFIFLLAIFKYKSMITKI